MYTQQSNGRPLRGSHPVQQRRLFYLTRDPRAGQRSGNGGHGGHQQAAGGEVGMQRQSPTMAAVQGRDGLQGGSIRPQLPQGLSITRPRENPQNTSPMQEQNLELEYDLLIGKLQYPAADSLRHHGSVCSIARIRPLGMDANMSRNSRLDRLSARDETFYKSCESTLTNLTERVEKLIVKVESFYKLIESAQAFPAPEGLDADGVDLGDMTNLVNF
ncbi:hypothetical protein CNYM01_14252 [Colletotrichum nymphaeae SA-01]|uniref:Uncharacterized protein n=2 Tax=Colletotrichum acutatum species complex TaxID=2707335 RepID=A0A135TRY3_9PEZI|nr:hypothetical protein CNYM01_14252 [Colletotrichum nymphaeae SA-01]